MGKECEVPWYKRDPAFLNTLYGGWTISAVRYEDPATPILDSYGETDLTPPFISLLTANLIIIVLAFAGNWDASKVIFIYWAQSVIIGIFTVITILGADTTAISAAMTRSSAKKGETGMVDPGRVRARAWILAVIFAI